MPTSHAAAQPRPLKGWHVLAALLTFFAVVIGTDVAFSIIAVRTFPGEDVKRSYLQGLHYNRTLEARAAQAKLGWTSTLELEARDGVPSAVVALQDRSGRAIAGAVVRAAIRRPATDRADRDVTFSPQPDRTYVARLPGLASGVWDVRGVAEVGGEHFAFERRVTWQASPAN